MTVYQLTLSCLSLRSMRNLWTSALSFYEEIMMAEKACLSCGYVYQPLETVCLRCSQFEKTAAWGKPPAANRKRNRRGTNSWNNPSLARWWIGSRLFLIAPLLFLLYSALSQILEWSHFGYKEIEDIIYCLVTAGVLLSFPASIISLLSVGMLCWLPKQRQWYHWMGLAASACIAGVEALCGLLLLSLMFRHSGEILSGVYLVIIILALL